MISHEVVEPENPIVPLKSPTPATEKPEPGSAKPAEESDSPLTEELRQEILEAQTESAVPLLGS